MPLEVVAMSETAAGPDQFRIGLHLTEHADSDLAAMRTGMSGSAASTKTLAVALAPTPADTLSSQAAASRNYFNFAYSALASFRMEMSGSASFQIVHLPSYQSAQGLASEESLSRWEEASSSASEVRGDV